MAATLFAAPFARAAGSTITVQTDASSYSGAQKLTASGAVSPAPGPGTAVFLKISNPAGTNVAVGQASVDGSTGSYQGTFVLGGTSAWTSGTYTLSATWGNSASTAPVNASVSFTYSPSVTTTTTTTSQTTTTATTSPSTTVTTTVTTVSTSTTTMTTTSVSTTTSTTTSISVQTSTLTSTTTTTATASALALSSDTLVLLGAASLVAILAIVGVVLVRHR